MFAKEKQIIYYKTHLQSRKRTIVLEVKNHTNYLTLYIRRNVLLNYKGLTNFFNLESKYFRTSVSFSM